MFKKMLFAFALLGSAQAFSQEGILKIEVKDSLSHKGLDMVTVLVENAGKVMARGETDEAGNLTLKNIPSGAFDVKVGVSGYNKKVMKNVLVRNNETTYLDFELFSGMLIEGYTVVEFEKPIIPNDPSIKDRFDAEEVKKSALTPEELLKIHAVETKPGVGPSYRGARADANVYIIDGQRVIGSANLPKMAIQQMSVTLGGVPAMYGDGTGAFVEIETRSGLVNPNKKWIEKE